MNTLDNYINTYLEHCKFRKRLDTKTLKAYTIDLKQYMNYCASFQTADYLSRNKFVFLESDSILCQTTLNTYYNLSLYLLLQNNAVEL